MAISEGVSCEICLRADDPEVMLWVRIEHAAAGASREAVICRACAWAIGRVCRSTGALPPLQEVVSES